MVLDYQLSSRNDEQKFEKWNKHYMLKLCRYWLQTIRTIPWKFRHLTLKLNFKLSDITKNFLINRVALKLVENYILVFRTNSLNMRACKNLVRKWFEIKVQGDHIDPCVGLGLTFLSFWVIQNIIFS